MRQYARAHKHGYLCFAMEIKSELGAISLSMNFDTCKNLIDSLVIWERMSIMHPMFWNAWEGPFVTIFFVNGSWYLKQNLIRKHLDTSLFFNINWVNLDGEIILLVLLTGLFVWLKVWCEIQSKTSVLIMTLIKINAPFVSEKNNIGAHRCFWTR